MTGIPLSDLLRIYFSTGDRRSYTICSKVVSDLRRVTVRATAPKSELVLRRLLRLEGFDMRARGGVVEICSIDSFAGVPASYGSPSPGLAAQMADIPTQDAPARPVERPRSRPAVVVPSQSEASPAASEASSVPVDVLKVIRLRHQPASVLLPALADLKIGQFSAPSSSRGREDGGSSVPVTGAGDVAGAVLLWRGLVRDWPDARKAVDALDYPVQTADVIIAAIVVSNSKTDTDALSFVGSLLGVGVSAGSATALSVPLGNLAVSLDSLRSRRDVSVLQNWSGTVESGSTVSANSGVQVGVATAITESEGGRARQSIEYRPTGVTISIAPVVLQDVVRARVVLEESTVVGGGSVPSFDTRKLEASMQSCYGCLTVVSRLVSDVADKSSSKFFFGLIPISRGSTVSSSRIVYVMAVAPRTWSPIADDRTEKTATGDARSGASTLSGDGARSSSPSAVPPMGAKK